MESLSVWIGTIFASFWMEYITASKIIKNIVDAGYKINVERLLEYSEEAPRLYSKEVEATIRLLPFVNVLRELQRSLNFNGIRSDVIDALSLFDVVEEMSEQEKEAYLEHPTASNAIKICLNGGTKEETPIKMDDDIGIGESMKAFFKTLSDSSSDTQLTDEEKRKRTMAILEVTDIDFNKKEPVKVAVNANTSVNLVEKQGQTTQNQNQILEDLEGKMLEQQLEQSTKTNSNPTYAKKRN